MKEDFMESLSRSVQTAAWFLLFSVFSTATVFGGAWPPSWWAPGKYNGVVIFDRWGGCYLYSGASVLAVSEKVKESLRPYEGQAVLVDVQEIAQSMNPGDGLITRLRVLGPSADITKPGLMGPPEIGGLHLSVAPDFGTAGNQLLVQLRNDA